MEGRGGGVAPVGAFSAASAFAFEEKGAYFGQVALVIRVASCQTAQLIANRRRGIGAARGVYCFLLPGKELAVNGGGGDLFILSHFFTAGTAARVPWQWRRFALETGRELAGEDRIVGQAGTFGSNS